MPTLTMLGLGLLAALLPACRPPAAEHREAILTLRYKARSTDGRPLSHWKATSVYRRTGSQWRIVHAHWSLVKDGGASTISSP